MKRSLTKRALSLALTLSMVLSMMIFTSAPVSAATAIFSEDFTTWTADNFAAKITAGGWSGRTSAEDAPLSASASLVSDYNGHTGTTFAVGSDDRLITTFAETPIKTGKYEVKIKLNPGKEPHTILYLGGSTPTIDGNKMSSSDWLFGVNFIWNSFKKDGATNTTLATADMTGSALLVSGKSFANANHWMNHVGQYDYKQWYDLSVKIDFDTRLVETNLYKEGEATPVVTYRYIMSDTAALGTLAVSNANNPFAIDSISIEPMSEALTVIADETFENLNLYKDWDNNMRDGYKSIMKSNWMAEKASRGGTTLIDTTSADGSTAFHLDATTFAEDSAHKTVMGFKQNAKNMQYDLYHPIKSGRVEISYDFYDPTGSGKPIVAITQGDTEGDDYAVLLSSDSTGFYPFWRPGTLVPASNRAAGHWYTVNTVVDLDKDTQDVTVKRGDQLIFKIIDQPLLKADSLEAPTQIDAIRVLNWGGTNPFYLDNFKINVLTEPKPVQEYVTVYEDDFEASESMDDVFANGWSATKDASCAALVTEDGNNYLTMKGFFDTVGSLDKRFATDRNSGKYRITFDAKVGSVAKGIYSFSDLYVPGNSSSLNEIGILANMGQKEIGHTNHNVDNGSEVLGEATGDWARIETVVDMSKKQIIYTLKDIETGGVLNSYTDTGFLSTDKAVMDGARAFRMMSYTNDATDNNVVCVDNIKIEYGYGKPELSNANVTVTDKNGNTTDITGTISPALECITLDFGDAITKASADANITMAETDAPANTVEFTGAVDGSKYVMTVPVLKGETSYTITVGADVANAAGLTLGKEVLIKFTTAKGESSITKKGLFAGETEITELSALTAGSTVTVKATAVNTTQEALDLAYIIAYYKGNILADTALAENDVAVGTNGEVTQDFTLPADMTGITKVKVFLWSNATELKPYCAAIEL